MHSAEEEFIRSLENLPATKVFNAVEYECRAFESTGRRRQPMEDAVNSILVFRQFLNAVMLGVPIAQYRLAAAHFAAFRRTINRLVEGGMLPENATEEFDNTFSAVPG